MDDVFAIKSAKKAKDAKKQKKERGYKAFEEDEPSQAAAKERLTGAEEVLSPTAKQPKPMKTIKSKVERFMPTAKKEKEKKVGDPAPSGANAVAALQVEIFGLDLDVVNQLSVSHDGVELPAFFRECIDYLEECGLECDGIYRVSGLKSKVQSLKVAFSNAIFRSEVLDRAVLDEDGAYVVASFVKAFLHGLPEPILGAALTPRFDEAACIRDIGVQIRAFRALLDQLRRSNYLLLATMIIHLEHVIAHQAENRMNQQNVSIVFAPSMRLSHRVLNVFFSYTRELFAGVTIQRYIPPIRVRLSTGEVDADGRPLAPTVTYTAELPERLAELDDELHKQESLLEHLHRQLARTTQADLRSQLEAELWEVPKLITKLKRKRTILLLETPEAIEAEMRKQEALLNKLHGELMVNRSGEPRASAKGADADKQEELWDVQRTITMLKRRLKLARKGELHVHAASGLVEPLAASAAATSGPLALTAPEQPIDEDDIELNLELAQPDESPAPPEPEPEFTNFEQVEVQQYLEAQMETEMPQSNDGWQGDSAGPDAPMPQEQPVSDVTAVEAVGSSGDTAEITTEAENQRIDDEPLNHDQAQIQMEADAASDTDLQVQVERPEGDVDFENSGLAQDEEADNSGESASESATSANRENEDSQSRSDLHLTLAIEAQSAEELQTLIVDDDAGTHSLAAPRSSESVNATDNNQCDSELLSEYHRLRFTNAELRLIGDELKQKIGQEQREIERLRNEIAVTQANGAESNDLFGDLGSSNASTVCQLEPERVWHAAAAKQTDNRDRAVSSSSSVSSSSNEPLGELTPATEDDSVALRTTVAELRGECSRIRHENAKLVEAIQSEKRMCADIKVEIHLLQRTAAQSHSSHRTPL